MNKVETVTTVYNEVIPIKQAKKFSDGYYKIGDSSIKNSGDCYLLPDGKYYRIKTGRIIYDEELGKYTFKSNDLVYGYINEKLEKGYFSTNEFENVIVKEKDGSINIAKNSKILENNLKYREMLSDGIYYHISLVNAQSLVRKIDVSLRLKESLDYSIGDNLSFAMKKYEEANSKKLEEVISPYDNFIIKCMKDYTFGLEFESIKGIVPNRICLKHGLVPLRDGSIPGLEYATIPLKQEKGIINLKQICKELEKRVSYDETCSLHLHLGNIPREPAFLIAFFKVVLGLQDEIFELFPIYKKYNFGFKRKSYTKPFNTFYFLESFLKGADQTTINNNMDVLLKFLTDGGYDFSNYDYDMQNIDCHPSDPKNKSKWNVIARYHFINLIPIIFGNKKTIEFRIHGPSHDYYKITSFMILCVAMIEYAKKNQSLILGNGIANIDLNSIFSNLKKVNEFESKDEVVLDYIRDYFFERRNFCYAKTKENMFFSEDEVPSIILPPHFTEESKNENISHPTGVLSDSLQEVVIDIIHDLLLSPEPF